MTTAKPPARYGAIYGRACGRLRYTELHHAVGHDPYHAVRPGFRIAEMEINPTQIVPWHYHNEVQDTFYVIAGAIRVFTRDPEEEVLLSRGETYSVRPRRPHMVSNAGTTSATFLVLQGTGDYDFVSVA